MPYPDDPLGHDIAKYNFPKEDLQAWWIADRSIEFLREQKNSNQPFFLFASFKEPHTPYKTVEPYWSKTTLTKSPSSTSLHNHETPLQNDFSGRVPESPEKRSPISQQEP